MATATRDQIIDASIACAEASDWEAVRLHEVAANLGLSLEDIRQEFREKDELIDAWFDRADSAMLQGAADLDISELSRQQRLQRAIVSWLDALSAHREVTRQMILGKLEPGHIHIQFPAILRISRTVQWMREAAGYDASFPIRAFEEVAHTSIYLAAFSCWMFDETPKAEATQRFLERQLQRAECAFNCCGCSKTGVPSEGANQSSSGETESLDKDASVEGAA
jgi:AcrR family transcriptional regulator